MTSSACRATCRPSPTSWKPTGGFVPNVFLIADAGYSSYATTIETMQATIDESPEVVECFVNGSILGWYNYLYGDNAAANEMILADNPDMTQDKIDYAIGKMIEWGIVDSGDALELGIGALTEEVVAGFYEDMVEIGVVEAGLDWSVHDQHLLRQPGSRGGASPGRVSAAR
jgi:NitT/TauT family transport system substrate-binding protein